MVALWMAAALAVVGTAAAQAPGGKCDLVKCNCGGVDLSGLKGKVYKAPTDAEGYAYSISICGEIPKAALPSGCQQYAEHPSVVKVSAVQCLSPAIARWPRPRGRGLGRGDGRSLCRCFLRSTGGHHSTGPPRRVRPDSFRA